MKFNKFILLAVTATFVIFTGSARAQISVSDDFTTPGGYDLGHWGNELGDWPTDNADLDAIGFYQAGSPNNTPATYSSVTGFPSLTDFTIDVNVHQFADGGVWLRSEFDPNLYGAGQGGVKNGVLLVAGGAGGLFSGLYFHTITDGVWSHFLQQWTYPSGDLLGSDATIKVNVSGNTYSASVNGTADPLTLINDQFDSGNVGLYCYQPTSNLSSFASFSLNASEPPSDTVVRTWTNNTGTFNWSFLSNWMQFAPPIFPSLPVNSDSVTLDGKNLFPARSNVVNYDVTGLSLNRLSADNNIVLNLTDVGGPNRNLTANYETIGVDGSATINQSGNGFKNTVLNDLTLGLNSRGSGTYELSGLADTNLEVDGVTYIGKSGSGLFSQTGGTVDLKGGFEIWNNGDAWHQYAGLDLGKKTGSTGEYDLASGTLNVSNATIVGDRGASMFSLNGGTHNTGDLYVGYNTGDSTSYYSLQSGTLNVIGGNGLMGVTVVGGKDYGPVGNGEFDQDSGVHNTAGLFIADSAGSFGIYSLHYDGLLSVGGFGTTVGSSGEGYFYQGGGTHTTPFLRLGWNPGSYGEYGFNNLVGDDDNGILNVNGDLLIGDMGTGRFNQSDGTNTVTGNLILANSPGGKGNYYLYGGKLAVSGDENIGVGGYGEFYQAFNSQNLVTGNVNLDSFFLSSSGTYTMNDKSYLKVGGDLNVGKATYGWFTMSNDSYINTTGDEHIGVNGQGYFVQNDWSSNNCNDLYLADNPGSQGQYSMNGGDLQAQNMFFGAGDATFTQNQPSGSIAVTNLWLGSNTGGTSTYLLQNGQIQVYESAQIGGAIGQGTFTQTGGILDVSTPGDIVDFNTINILNGTGTYNLEGGTVFAHVINNGGNLNYRGGDLWSGLYNTPAGVTTFQADNNAVPLVAHLDVDNAGHLDVINSQAEFAGWVTNEHSGAIHITNSAVTFDGPVVNNGAFITDPSTATFNADLTVGPDGSLQGGSGDVFKFGGNLLSTSTNPAWNTGLSEIVFFGGVSHDLSLVGGSNSCKWGTLVLDLGNALHNPDGSFTLVVTNLLLPNGLGDLGALTGSGFDVTFMNLQTLDKGGNLIPLEYTAGQLPGNVHAAPEPISSALFLLGGAGLAFLRRRKLG